MSIQLHWWTNCNSSSHLLESKMRRKRKKKTVWPFYSYQIFFKVTWSQLSPVHLFISFYSHVFRCNFRPIYLEKCQLSRCNLRGPSFYAPILHSLTYSPCKMTPLAPCCSFYYSNTHILSQWSRLSLDVTFINSHSLVKLAEMIKVDVNSCSPKKESH